MHIAAYGGLFEMMVPLGAKVPPADAMGDQDPSDAVHLAHALLTRIHAVHAGVRVGEAVTMGAEGQFAAKAVLRSAMKAPASPRGTKPRSSRP